MENSQTENEQVTNEEDVQTSTTTEEFTEEQLAQMKLYVADRMFSSMSLTQTLQIAENECRQQAGARVDQATPQDLQEVFNDMNAAIFANQLQREGQIQEGEAPQQESVSEEDCCEDKEACEKEECQPSVS